MLNFTNILFDFDGTICDTSIGIFASMRKVCAKYNLPFGNDTFVKMIGPSLEEGFTKYFRLPQNEIQNAVNIYREYYSAEGMFICEPYSGIKELILALRASGKRVFVATSKPEVYTKRIIERKGIADLFDFVGGSDIEEKIRFNKADVINYVLAENSLSDKRDSVLMIGDRFYDINGAHSAGLKAIGVLWGFGDRTELEQSGADYICETVEEVKKLLL
ncbi:MAG: HAD hydrolase-like protein [Spirochaetales bacterium]|nr:HAD hydrolase-like protein [Spirochaetales bacterium]